MGRLGKHRQLPWCSLLSMPEKPVLAEAEEPCVNPRIATQPGLVQSSNRVLP